MVRISVGPLCGFGVGFEFTQQVHDESVIDYCLIDIFILRFQVAWYSKDK